MECIARAKTLQLNLTGMVWWLEVRNCARKSFYVLARRIYLFWCSSVRLRKPYSCLVRKPWEKRRAGSGLSRWPLTTNWKLEIAGTSGWSVPISQSQTTVFVGQWMEWDSLPPCVNIEKQIHEELNQTSSAPKTDRSFTSIQMVHTHASLPRGYFLPFAEWFGKLLLGPWSWM